MTTPAEVYLFWCAAVVPGLASFLLNTSMRGSDVINTSGADLMMIIFSFDLAGIFIYNDLIKYVAHPEMRAAFFGVLVILMIISLCWWVLLIRTIEPRLRAITVTPFDTAKKILWFGFCWIGVLILASAHILVFMVKEGKVNG